MMHRRWAWTLLLAVSGGCPETHSLEDAGFDASIEVRDAGRGDDAGRADVGERDVPDDGFVPPDVAREDAGLDLTRTYVLTTMDVPAPTASGEAPGIDLDGRVSTGASTECSDVPDWISPATGAPGIDNQFAAHLLGTLSEPPRDTVAADLERGRLTAFSVSGIDSFDRDDAVVVHAFHASTASGEPPVFVDGRLAPGQVLIDQGDLGTSPGRIIGGRLETGFSGIGLPVRVGTRRLPITIREFRLTTEITDTALIRGELGGRIAPDDVAGVLEIGIYGDLLRCEGVSIGVAFEAVSALLSPSP